MTKAIPLPQGYMAIVDDDQYDRLSQYKWSIIRRPHHVYAFRSAVLDGRKVSIGMHRAIMNPAKGFVVDHINGNTLDNRKDNLRVCTHTQNLRSSRKYCRSASQYKGVTWDGERKRWRARLRIQGKDVYLGQYAEEKAAAMAYNVAAQREFGEFAVLNAI